MNLETMTVQQLINAYYLAYEARLVDSVNLNGHRSSSITKDALIARCQNFPHSLLEEASSISNSEAFSRYEKARLKD